MNKPSSVYGAAATAYLEAGWSGVLPLPARAKANPPGGYTGRAGAWPTEDDVSVWAAKRPDANVGLRLPEDVVGIDVDAYGGKPGAATLHALSEELGALPPTVLSTSRDGGVAGIRLFRVPPRASWSDPGPGVEVIHHGWRYLVVWPSIHPEGGTYRFVDQRTGEVLEGPPRPEELAALPAAWVARLSSDETPDAKSAVTSDEARAFLAALPRGEPCRATSRALCASLKALEAGASRHDVMVQATLRLVRVGDLGHRGARAALDRLTSTFVEAVTGDGSRSADEAIAEVLRAVEGAVAVVLGDPADDRGCRCGTATETRRVSSPSLPMDNARRFLEDRYGHPEHRTLVAHGGNLYAWDGSCWPEVEDAALESALWHYFEPATYLRVKGDNEPTEVRFPVNRNTMADVKAAVRAVAHVPASVEAPSWLGDGNGDDRPPAAEFLAAANGLVHLPTRTLHPATPRFFAHHAVPYAFDPDAARPQRWLAFLHDLWHDHPDVIETLQEMFGYLLSGDTSAQKMFLLVGPKRAGKGTIGRVLTSLVGPHNVAGPTLQGLGTQFGLANLIGKPLALISDARFRSGDTTATERLLLISGEDAVDVDRKHREPWFGRLPTRFVIMTNEVPRLTDASGALASRFVVLPFLRSFLGREDFGLDAALAEELPGILLWALDGLDRLRTRGGRFVQPVAGEEALQDLEDLGSPLSVFLREECELGEDHAVPTAVLYGAWRAWCTANGREPGSSAAFGRDLRAALPTVKRVQRRVDGRVVAHYAGLRHRDATAVTGRVTSASREPSRVLETRSRRSEGGVTGVTGSELVMSQADKDVARGTTTSRNAKSPVTPVTAGVWNLEHWLVPHSTN